MVEIKTTRVDSKIRSEEVGEAKEMARITIIKAVDSIIIRVVKSSSIRRWEAEGWAHPVSSKHLTQIETLGNMTDLRSSWKSSNATHKASLKAEAAIITQEHKVKIMAAFTRVLEKEASEIYRSSQVI